MELFFFNIIHVRLHTQLFLNKYIAIFRGIRYKLNIANFENTKINNIFKCLRRGVDKLKVHPLNGGGVTLKTYQSNKGEGVQKSMKLSIHTFEWPLVAFYACVSHQQFNELYLTLS